MKTRLRTWLGLAVTAVLVCAGLASVTVPSAQAATRAFVVTCKPSHTLPDDPIVVPGQPGASHLHEFFGNVGTDAYSTAASMQGAASTCPNGDRSAYWVPSLYQNGKRVTPTSVTVYYENRATSAGPLTPFPSGFRIVLGNARATTATTTEKRWVWGCSDNTQIGGDVPPANCASGSIQLRSQWPNCWDGKRGATDDSAHVRFSSGGTCPVGFTTPLPTLRMNVVYRTGTTTGDITLSSGGGSVYSKHGDFFNGWDAAVLRDLVDRCLNAGDGRCAHFTGSTTGAAAVPAPASTSTPRATTSTAPAAAKPVAAKPTATRPTSTRPAPTQPTQAQQAVTQPVSSSRAGTASGSAAAPAAGTASSAAASSAAASAAAAAASPSGGVQPTDGAAQEAALAQTGTAGGAAEASPTSPGSLSPGLVSNEVNRGSGRTQAVVLLLALMGLLVAVAIRPLRTLVRSSNREAQPRARV